ncbi:MAG: hypothetical protein ACTSQJ_16675, partial [Promethearchaeota archaeon]
ARGFAGVIARQLEPLNNNDKFKHVFRNTEAKILLNATDGRYAGMVIINKGTVSVESVKNQPKESLKKKILGWDAKLETNTQLFLEIAMGKLGTGAMLKKIISRKIKVKGIKKLVLLQKMFAILTESQEKEN